MNIYLKKGDVEGRTKYIWSTQPGANVVATLTVKTVAPTINLEEIVAHSPSIWAEKLKAVHP